VIEVALHAGRAAGGRCDVGLAGEPGGQPVGRRNVPDCDCAAVTPKSCGVGRCGSSQAGEALFEQLVHGRAEGRIVVGRHQTGSECVLLEGVKPGVEDRPERARGTRRRREAFAQSPVHRLQPVQGRLGLGDLHLGHRHSSGLGALTQPASEEGLARAVLAADSFERSATGMRGVEVGGQAGLDPFQTDGEQVEPTSRDGAASQRVEHLASAPRRYRLVRHRTAPEAAPRRARSSRPHQCG
jgi:hypothetical protein